MYRSFGLEAGSQTGTLRANQGCLHTFTVYICLHTWSKYPRAHHIRCALSTKATVVTCGVSTSSYTRCARRQLADRVRGCGRIARGQGRREGLRPSCSSGTGEATMPKAGRGRSNNRSTPYGCVRNRHVLLFVLRRPRANEPVCCVAVTGHHEMQTQRSVCMWGTSPTRRHGRT